MNHYGGCGLLYFFNFLFYSSFSPIGLILNGFLCDTNYFYFYYGGTGLV